ncbi:uncharacterized protein MYCFIDRAFT_170756 [Pseudocercospora fijiensis CIRAD86]|uniref:Uncharacterized protein n=1 Tax=Pseudocercospora fijiensis (strain CIRAD86) TaxID=383855 RepID=N1QCG4_PSEFD|nr:uncharacterized protein MYCFIDRAFT_170756 [Pseudocercospora fijiensis CIRAD86]EME89272.1 hypothetical protein MYCFIDRAFT_170756 [Pseudocercospora fijiensis CIRAD86]
MLAMRPGIARAESSAFPACSFWGLADTSHGSRTASRTFPTVDGYPARHWLLQAPKYISSRNATRCSAEITVAQLTELIDQSSANAPALTSFSHATGLTNNQIAWDHISSKELYSLILRAGPPYNYSYETDEDQEHVDIGSYIDAALEMRQQDRQDGDSLALEQLPIFGITKESLFAIRYTVNGEVCLSLLRPPRRVQLRLQDVEQCKQIVQVLEHRGLMYQEQRPRTARPATATSRPGIEHSEDRPSSAQASSPHFEPPQPQKAYQRPREAFTFVPRKSSIDARLVMHSHNALRPTRPYQLPQAPLFPREEASAPREPKISGPTTAEIYGTRPEPYKASGPQTFQRTTVPDALGANGRPQPFAATHLQEEPPRTLEQHAAPSSSDPGLPRSADLPHLQHMSSTENHMPAPWSSDLPDSRPVTALSTSSVADLLEQQIPPRRELPFKRPSSSSKSDASSRPGSSALSLPLLKRARADKTNPQSSTRPHTALKKADKPATSQSIRPATTSSSSMTAQGVRGASGRADRESRPLSPEVSTQPSVSRAIPVDELLYGQRTLSMRKDHMNMPRIGSITDAPHEIESPPGSAVSRIQDTAPGQITSASTLADPRDQSLNRAYAAANVSANRTHEASLEQYEAQNLEDRKAALDKFMMDNLENPAFTTLCEDVENCWRRIALGL